MPLNIRPKNDPSAPAYNPQRDLAYMGPFIFKASARLLDCDQWSDQFSEDLKAANVTNDQFCEAAQVYGKALQLFMTEKTIKEPVEAMRAVGLFELKGLANRLYFSAFGEMIFAIMLRGLREVTRLGTDPIMQPELADYLGYAEQYLKAKGVTLPPAIDTATADVHSLRMTVAHQSQLIELLQNQLEEKHGQEGTRQAAVGQEGPKEGCKEVLDDALEKDIEEAQRGGCENVAEGVQGEEEVQAEKDNSDRQDDQGAADEGRKHVD